MWTWLRLFTESVSTRSSTKAGATGPNASLTTALAKQRFSVMLGRVVPEIPGQKFTFDSSNDLKMATDMVRAWNRTP